jgi:hypothetical protein
VKESYPRCKRQWRRYSKEQGFPISADLFARFGKKAEKPLSDSGWSDELSIALADARRFTGWM